MKNTWSGFSRRVVELKCWGFWFGFFQASVSSSVSGWLTLSEVLKEEISDFNHSWHNCWSGLSREKKNQRGIIKGEKDHLKFCFHVYTKYILEGKNCCWHMKQDALGLRGLRGHVLLLPFPFDTMQRWIFFLLFGNLCSKVEIFNAQLGISMLTRIFSSQLDCGLAGWMDPLQTCESGRCWFQDQDHLECNEKKSAIASNQCIQLFLKKHYGNFFLSQSVSHLREC